MRIARNTGMLVLLVWAHNAAADEPSAEERVRLSQLSSTLSGAVVYTSDKRVKKITVGEVRPVDLGPGECARFSPDGKRVAVHHERQVYIVGSNGGAPTPLIDDADEGDGCSIEFHSNNREVIFWRKKQGFFTVDITTRAVKRMPLPGEYSGEPVISADGQRMAARWDNDLYEIDLVAGTHRKYANGCSPGVSPDGAWVMRNVGSHKRLRVERWGGGEGFELDASTCRPDGSWDNHHWSNHANFIVGQGEKVHAVYVIDVAKNEGTRVTWERGNSPDLHVTRATVAKQAQKTATAPTANLPAWKNWPGNTQGLVWLWEDAAKPNEVAASGGRSVHTCRVEPKQGAKFGRGQVMDLGGGAFTTEAADERLLQAVRAANAFTLELVLTADGAKAKQRGNIVSFGNNVRVSQDDEELELSLRTTDDGHKRTTLGLVVPGKPTHVMISYRPGLLAYFVDGQRVFTSQAGRGDLSNWEAATLLFGAPDNAKRVWRGTVEAVALYARFVDAAEAAQKAALVRPRLEARKPLPRSDVKGRVVSVTAIPDPASIAPYRRALVVFTYDVLQGMPPRRVQVAHWGLLDTRTVKTIAVVKVGDERTLQVEAFDAHPELESERLVSDADSADMPLYYDVSPVERGDLGAAL